eukprot:CAMPEP_0198312680 /NCGR_PEP_ID=MMETSP1450-20131203/3972_1 /TAXON_ID=753684 ORGANISM="Madagascaria erythrocladiodes, Strain CCMP3234" /NCGR_SAMPLE_ID=MMETSP1450 /ASSEMBLY_ACC=CAM_ASM_001115 /LENGTH=811 /DNA_ID=CAMNT_0044015637 /DNA_START=326 /DNA_END=2761 /DNA_ORIENTATION=-
MGPPGNNSGDGGWSNPPTRPPTDMRNIGPPPPFWDPSQGNGRPNAWDSSFPPNNSGPLPFANLNALGPFGLPPPPPQVHGQDPTALAAALLAAQAGFPTQMPPNWMPPQPPQPAQPQQAPQPPQPPGPPHRGNEWAGPTAGQASPKRMRMDGGAPQMHEQVQVNPPMPGMPHPAAFGMPESAATGSDSNRAESENENRVMTFKEFLGKQDDSITPAAAQELYKQYLKSNDQSGGDNFFDEHKDEEWFRELYHPAWIAARAVAIREQTAERAADFKKKLEEKGPESLPLLQAGPDGLPEEQVSSSKKTTLFFRSIPAAATRSQLETILRGVDGKLNVEDIRFGEVAWNQNALQRFMWVVYATEQDTDDALDQLNDKRVEITIPPPEISPGSGKIEDSAKNVEPKTMSVKLDPVRNREKRKRSHSLLPRMSIRPQRLRFDATQSEKVMRHMDAMRKVPDELNPLTRDFLTKLDSDRKRIDACAAYLLEVHLLCYYTGNNYIDDPSGVLPSPKRPHEANPQSDLPLDEKVNEIHPNDKSQWERKIDERMAYMMEVAFERSRTGADNGSELRERRITEWIASKTKMEGPERYRCLLPPMKLFKGPEFVAKYIRSKHPADLAKVRKEADEESFNKNYLDDPDRLTDSSRGQPRAGNGGGYRGGLGFDAEGEDPAERGDRGGKRGRGGNRGRGRGGRGGGGGFNNNYDYNRFAPMMGAEGGMPPGMGFGGMMGPGGMNPAMFAHMGFLNGGAPMGVPPPFGPQGEFGYFRGGSRGARGGRGGQPRGGRGDGRRGGRYRDLDAPDEDSKIKVVDYSDV